MIVIRIILGLASYFLFSWIFRSIGASFIEEHTNLIKASYYFDAIPAVVAYIITIIFQLDYEDEYHNLISLAVIGCGYLLAIFLPYSIGMVVLVNLIFIIPIVYYACKLK